MIVVGGRRGGSVVGRRTWCLPRRPTVWVACGGGGAVELLVHSLQLVGFVWVFHCCTVALCEGSSREVHEQSVCVVPSFPTQRSTHPRLNVWCFSVTGFNCASVLMLCRADGNFS